MRLEWAIVFEVDILKIAAFWGNGVFEMQSEAIVGGTILYSGKQVN